MTGRHIRILAAVAVALVGLVFVLDIADDSDEPAAGALLLPAFASAADGLSAIKVKGSGDEAAVTLGKQDQKWVVSNLHNYPADLGKLRALVLALAEARVMEEKTANPDFYHRLGVADPDAGGSGTRITLEGEGMRQAVILGKVVQGNYRYARLADADRSVLIDRNPEVPGDPSDWLDSLLVDVPADKVKRVTITHADGEKIVIEKESETQGDFRVLDLPEGRVLAYATVANAIGGTLANLRLDSVRPAVAGEAATTIVFATFEGGTITVTAYPAADDAETTWFAFKAEPDLSGLNARTAGWEYRLPSFKKNQLTRRWEDLLKKTDSE